MTGSKKKVESLPTLSARVGDGATKRVFTGNFCMQVATAKYEAERDS